MKIHAHPTDRHSISSLRRLGSCTLFLLSLATPFLAQAIIIPSVTYTWTGQGQSENLFDTGNWLDDSAPPTASWDVTSDIEGIHLLFGASRRSYTTYGELYANQLEFRSINQPYNLDASANTTHIGSGGILYNPTGDIYSTISGPIQLHGSQVWNISAGTLRIDGSISDYDGIEFSLNYQIEKTGAGTLELEGGYGNVWEGGLKLTGGTVIFKTMMGSAAGSLGNGTLTFNGGTLKAERGNTEIYGSNSIDISNNIISNGRISLITRGALNITNSESEVNFFRLDADTTIEIKGSEVFVAKDITESGGSRKLTLNADTALILMGSSGWTGGTNVISGALIFGGTNNTPGTTSGIEIGADGYAGIGVSNNVAGFLSEINKTTSRGTIGFDSDVESSVDTFTSDVDLTGFNADIRLGSATAAIISGTITPQGTDYRFGGGGGTLFVSSLLTDPVTTPATIPGAFTAAATIASNVIVDSTADHPLTVQFLNPGNSFSGTLQVTNSAAIFGDGVSLPGTTGNFTMDVGSYIGNAHDPDGSVPELSILSFLGHFTATTPGIIGFDITPQSTSTREVDLTGVDITAFTGGVYLGTASVLRDAFGDISGPGVRFTGTIGADANGVHRFAAYKGAALDVAGILTGTSLIIGSPDSPGSFGDQQRQQRSIVLVSGNNTGKLVNGVTLYGGELKVGQATGDGTIGIDATNALGSGIISVMPVNFTLGDNGENDRGPEPSLTVSSANIIINNPIALSTDLLIGDSNDFKLGGIISGTGEIYIGNEPNNSVNITFGGNNTHTGGIYISNSNTATFTHDNAVGMGALGFGGQSGGVANFQTANPTIYGLSSNGSSATINLNFSGNRIFTINQAAESNFGGYIYGYGASTIIKDGAGLLNFSSGTIYSSGIADGQGNDVALEIKNGTFVFDQNASLSGGAIKVNGGTLAITGGVFLNSPITISSGRIAGFGTYGSAVSIGAGAILSPGLAGRSATGSMSFTHLELNSGGVYEFNIQDPNPENNNGRDHINVFNQETLVINSTSANPFVIKVISLDTNGEIGRLSGIDPGNGLYSWTLFSFTSLSIPGTSNIFSADLFSLDLSEFSSDALYGGTFSLFQNNNDLVLGFTPVPEPSTYALMALGLGMIIVALRRRRSKS